MVEHRIDTGNAVPIKQPLRRQGAARRQIEIECLEKMLKDDIIEESNSPWGSPIVLVKKKCGETRLCVDYRKLNDVTRKDAYPLPDIQMFLDSLSGSSFFCSLDLASG